MQYGKRQAEFHVAGDLASCDRSMLTFPGWERREEIERWRVAAHRAVGAVGHDELRGLRDPSYSVSWEHALVRPVGGVR